MLKAKESRFRREALIPAGKQADFKPRALAERYAPTILVREPQALSPAGKEEVE